MVVIEIMVSVPIVVFTISTVHVCGVWGEDIHGLEVLLHTRGLRVHSVHCT